MPWCPAAVLNATLRLAFEAGSSFTSSGGWLHPSPPAKQGDRPVKPQQAPNTRALSCARQSRHHGVILYSRRPSSFSAPLALPVLAFAVKCDNNILIICLYQWSHTPWHSIRAFQSLSWGALSSARIRSNSCLRAPWGLASESSTLASAAATRPRQLPKGLRFWKLVTAMIFFSRVDGSNPVVMSRWPDHSGLKRSRVPAAGENVRTRWICTSEPSTATRAHAQTRAHTYNDLILFQLPKLRWISPDQRPHNVPRGSLAFPSLYLAPVPNALQLQDLEFPRVPFDLSRTQCLGCQTTRHCHSQAVSMLVGTVRMDLWMECLEALLITILAIGTSVPSWSVRLHMKSFHNSHHHCWLPFQFITSPFVLPAAGSVLVRFATLDAPDSQKRDQARVARTADLWPVDRRPSTPRQLPCLF